MTFYLEVLLILFLGFSSQGCDDESGKKLMISCNKMCKIAFGKPPRAALGAVWCDGGEEIIDIADVPHRDANGEMKAQCQACRDQWDEQGCMPADGTTVSKACEFDFCVLRKLHAINLESRADPGFKAEGIFGYGVHPDLLGEITEEAAALREQDRAAQTALSDAEKVPSADEGQPKAPEASPPAPATEASTQTPASALQAAAKAAGHEAAQTHARGFDRPPDPTLAPAPGATTIGVGPSGDVAPFAAAAGGPGPLARSTPGSLVDLPDAKKTLAQARVHNA